MSELEKVVREIVNSVVDQRLASLPQPKPSSLSSSTRERIAQYEVLAHKTYLTKEELAVYLGCSERSIDEWSARAIGDNPLPVGYVGSHMRVKREKADQWVENEANRKRLKLAS